MKKLLYTFVLLIMPIMVNANSQCSVEEQSELKTEANLIKFDYETGEKERDPNSYLIPEGLTEEEKLDWIFYDPYVKINILNLTENFYVEISNDLNDEIKTVYYTDFVDGQYSFENSYLYEVTTYTFTVKSSDTTGCADESIKISYLTTPKYNVFSENDSCNEFPDEAVCQKFTTNKNLDVDNFTEEMEDIHDEKIEEETNGNNTETEETEESSLLLIILIILGIAIIAGIAIFMKKRGKNEKK